MTGHGPASTGSVPETAPLVSVVIPTRGRPALLVETLASITAQDYAGPLEIIVVHDREECDPTLARLSRPNREIVSMVNTRTGGLCGARNTGVLASRGAFVASCDDDDLWYPAKVRLQVERLLADPSLLAVGAGIRLLMGERGNVDWQAREDVISHERLLENRVKELHSSTLMMRRSAFDEAGLYDEELPHGYGEDYDWLLRASRVGQGRRGDRRSSPTSARTSPRGSGTARSTPPPRWSTCSTSTPTSVTADAGTRGSWARSPTRGPRPGSGGRSARIAGRALRVYPAATHAWLALAVAGPGIEPRRMLSVARRLGRGLS